MRSQVVGADARQRLVQLPRCRQQDAAAQVEVLEIGERRAPRPRELGQAASRRVVQIDVRIVVLAQKRGRALWR